MFQVQNASPSIATTETKISLAKRFPQLGLSDSSSLRCLEEEFLDFTLPPSELPSITTYDTCDNNNKVCAGSFWWEIRKMKTFYGEPRFPKLTN